MKIHHIGIAVSDLEAAKKTYRDGLGLKHMGDEDVTDAKVKVAFFKTGESSIELFEPYPDNEGVKRFLEKKGDGIHHIALKVDSIETELKRVQASGMKPIDLTPRPGAHNTLVAFLHPKSANGVLIELVEEQA